MILYAALFSCIDPIFSIAAYLSYKDPFYTPSNGIEKKRADKQKEELGDDMYSDHIIRSEALYNFERVEYVDEFCRENYLSSSTSYYIIDMKKQFASLLFDMKFLSSPDTKHLSSNINSSNKSLIRAILTAALYPNAAKISYF